MKHGWGIILLLLAWTSVPTLADTLHINVYDGHRDYLLHSRSYSTAWDILRKAAAVQNITIEAQEAPWIRSITFLRKSKGVNAVFGAMPSSKRRQWSQFSAPLAVEYIAAYTNVDKAIDSFSELMERKLELNIGVTKGSIHQDIAKQLGFQYVITFTKRESMFEMLKHRKIDALIYTHALTNFYCAKVFNFDDKDCVKQIGQPIENSTIHFMYRGEHDKTSALAQRINAGVTELYVNGEIARLFSEKGYRKADYNFWQSRFIKWKNSEANAN